MKEYRDYAAPPMDIPRTFGRLNEILTGSDMRRLNVPSAAPLAEELAQKLQDYAVAVAGLESVRERDLTGRDPAFATERERGLRARSSVETYCSIQLVTKLNNLLDVLPATTEADTVRGQIRTIRERLTSAAERDSNVLGEAPHGVQVGTADDQNPTPDDAPPTAARRVVDRTFVVNLRALIEDMMERVRQAQQMLHAVDTAPHKAPPTREKRTGPERQKPTPQSSDQQGSEREKEEPKRTGPDSLTPAFQNTDRRSA